ncbi:saccharopine dehydrogenase family protein [Nannocystaceae bacterium ST9]
MPKKWVLYGAYGETGQFISTHAVALGLQPTLAGRDAGRLTELSARLGLEHRVATLDDPRQLDALLADAALVINCAGPFAATAMPMVDACLRTHTHYLDLSGEYRALQAVLERDDEAHERGVLLLPGAGFDVIPTDCVAARLHEALPTGDRLELAIINGLALTRGTVARMLDVLAVGPLVRREGELVRLSEPSSRTIVFNRRTVPCVSLAWGDLVSAWHSTAIPNITVYVQTLEHRGAPVHDLDRLADLLRANLAVEAPRPAGRSGVWGRVTNREGERAEATLDLPDNLAFTATATCAIACKILEDELRDPSGATTPSRLLGSQFVLDLPGVGGFGLRRETRA